MALRIDHKILVQISTDTAQKNKRFFHEDDTSHATSITTLDLEVSGELSIADAATKQLDFGALTDARGFYMEVTAPCNVRLNSGVQDIPVAFAPGKTVAKVFWEGAVTSIRIENTVGDASVLTGSYTIWGEPTP